jgi:hypothetical protein
MSRFAAAARNSQLNLSLPANIYEAVTLARRDDAFEKTVLWLQRQRLTGKTQTYRSDRPWSDANPTCALSCQRASAKTEDEIRLLREQYASSSLSIDRDALWREHRDPAGAVRLMDVERLPADAMAFYRSFHFEPLDDWGIYLYVDQLWSYCEALYAAMSRHIHSFTRDILIGYVLFEVFHHEFFHHIVECAVTTLEVMSPCFSPARPLYLEYKQHQYEHADFVGPHPHRPLEEALANAYAYNSLSFISRIKAGYRTTLVKLYQAMLERYWPGESAGYNEAENYTGGQYVDGAAQLLAMLLQSGEIDGHAARLISRTVLLTGNSAYFAKPDIPTYLVGSPENLERFYKSIPAPCETYTQLFWPGNTNDLDGYIQQRKKELKEKRSPPPKTSG